MNVLFPVFLKLHQINTLLVGGGNVGLEKLNAILQNSPEARVTVVAGYFLPETLQLAQSAPFVQIVQRNYLPTDLEGKQLVICATDNQALHEEIVQEAHAQNILVNVADTPHLCDFYLGSVVRKNELKIAISTNGKSPTFAKRLREYLEDALPEGSIQELLEQLHAFRNQLKGDFAHKINVLNEVTAGLLNKK
jgi:siroheme synthase-like protein